MNRIVGQRKVLNLLAGSLSDPRHAYIFHGPEGIGKKMLADCFARAILCEKPVIDTDNGVFHNCGVCSACGLLNENAHPDFKILSCDEGSLKVDNVRDFIADIHVQPLYSACKTYIINDGDRMTHQAQNALLKTFEEPPGFAVIIITASNKSQLLPTIVSRAAVVDFSINTQSEIVQFLHERDIHSELDMEFVAAFSGGIPGKAEKVATSRDFALLRDQSIEVCRTLSDEDLLAALQCAKFFEDNKNKIDIILDCMILWYRDLLIADSLPDEEEKILINRDKKDTILSDSLKHSGDSLMAMMQHIEETRRAIKCNANFSLAVEVMLMKIQGEAVNG